MVEVTVGSVGHIVTPDPGVWLATLALTRGQALCRQIIVGFVEFPPLGIRLILDKVRNIEDVVDVVAIPAGQHARHLKLLAPGLAPLASLIKLGLTRNFDGDLKTVFIKNSPELSTRLAAKFPLHLASSDW